MTKIITAKYKASRRLGISIWGDGKDPFNKKNYKPGQHGATSIGKASDYGLHLRAKQRVKSHYGRINERQFRKIFTEAERMRGNTGENFTGLLETRLDSAIYRLTVAPTIFAARQLVSHGHVKINGKRVNIPSYTLKIGDVIEVKDSSRQLPVIALSVAKGDRKVPDYYSFDANALSGKLLRIPQMDEIPYPFDPEINLVVEFYSR